MEITNTNNINTHNLKQENFVSVFNFPEETYVAVSDLSKILQKIHNRIIAEGYLIENGIIIKTK